MKRRAAFIIFAVLAATVIALSAPIAAADAPVKSEFVFSDTGVVQGGCPFEVVNSASGSGTETDFFDSSGNLRRIHLHVTEVIRSARMASR
jgi:hypothetical protein